MCKIFWTLCSRLVIKSKSWWQGRKRQHRFKNKSASGQVLHCMLSWCKHDVRAPGPPCFNTCRSAGKSKFTAGPKCEKYFQCCGLSLLYLWLILWWEDEEKHNYISWDECFIYVIWWCTIYFHAKCAPVLQYWGLSSGPPLIPSWWWQEKHERKWKYILNLGSVFPTWI